MTPLIPSLLSPGLKRLWQRLWQRRLLRRLIQVSVACMALIALGWGALEVGVRISPYPREALDAGRDQSLRLRDRDGTLLRESVNTNGHRVRWLPLDEINPMVVQATVAVEDARFYEHNGVDVPAILRAMGQNLTAGRIVSGASTLTMQLARLVAPHPRSFVHKMIEAVQARRLEQTLTKSEILEHWLNRAPYGAGAIGIEAASLRYFGKPNRHLSLGEAALIAGLPQGPGRLNPLKHLDRALRRQHTVLTRMLEEGYITRQQHDLAYKTPLVWQSAPPAPTAMHFTEAVMNRHREALSTGGDVKTTLDLDLQRDLEVMARDHVTTLADKGLTQAAVVVLDNASCEVLAMVGSTDYADELEGAVNGAMAPRQPGSTLKPFTYALAFENGQTPATIVPDIPTRYRDAHGTEYAPQNYGRLFHGPVMIAEALARSLNVPAIRVLQQVGAEPLLTALRRAGVASLDQSSGHYGLGLTLGNGEVTLLELAQAYALFPRGGHACRARFLKNEGAPTPSDRVFSPVVAHLITWILADEPMRVEAFGPRNALMAGFPVAVKTGTSENWRDAWAVGFTGQYTVAVWSGDFAGRPMHKLAGAAGAGPLFTRALHRVAGSHGERGAPLYTLVGPAARDDSARAIDRGVQMVKVCARSGAAPGDHCPVVRSVPVQAPDGTPPVEVITADAWFTPVAIDRRTGLKAGPRCPKRYVDRQVFAHLPAMYASWQAGSDTLPAPPQRYSPLCPAEGPVPDALVITSPAPDEIFLLEPGARARDQAIALEALVDPPQARVTWLVDGRPVARVGAPWKAHWSLKPGAHTLEVVAGLRRSDPVRFEVR